MEKNADLTCGIIFKLKILKRKLCIIVQGQLKQEVVS